MKILYIEWIDAASDTGWFSKNRAQDWLDEKSKMISCGVYVTENKNFICIATTINTETEYSSEAVCNLQKIPKKWILKKKYLKLK